MRNYDIGIQLEREDWIMFKKWLERILEEKAKKYIESWEAKEMGKAVLRIKDEDKGTWEYSACNILDVDIEGGRVKIEVENWLPALWPGRKMFALWPGRKMFVDKGNVLCLRDSVLVARSIFELQDRIEKLEKKEK